MSESQVGDGIHLARLGRVIPILPQPGNQTLAGNLYNPSILALDEDRFLISFRISNYLRFNGIPGRRLSFPGRFGGGWLQVHLANGAPAVKSAIGFCEFNSRDETFSAPFQVDEDFSERYSGQVHDTYGDEDIRLFRSHGEIRSSGTFIGADQLGRMVEASIQVSGSSVKYRARPIRHPREDQFQKNWMPIEGDGNRFITDHEPFRICTVADGQVIEERVGNGLSHAHGLRGSTQMIAWDGGYLGLVHNNNQSAKFSSNYKLEYKHYLLFANHDFSEVKISSEFVFFGLAVEYCTGIALVGSEFFLTFQVADSASYLLRLDESVVRRLQGSAKS